MKGIIKIAIIAAVIYAAVYFWNKKQKDTKPYKKPCTCGQNSAEKDSLIDEVLQKHQAFIHDLAQQFNVPLSELDLAWLEEKTPAELKELLNMNYAEFKTAVLSDIDV